MRPRMTHETTHRSWIAALVAAVLVGGGLAAGDWPLFRGDSKRSGNPGGAAVPAALEKEWVFRSEGRKPSVDSSPAIAGDAIYVGVAEQSVFRRSGRVVCIDAASGALKWERKTAKPVFSSPAVADGRVFIGEGYHQDTGCKVICLDAATGEDRWEFATGSHVESSPAVHDGRVYFGAGDDGLHCVDAASGKAIWHFEDAHVDISPLVASGLVFAGTGYGGTAAICLSARDGSERWRSPIDLPVWGSPVLVGTRVYYGLGNGNLIASDEEPRGRVVCLAATSGKKLWSRDFPDAVHTAVAAAGRTLLVGCRDGHLYALDAAKGDIEWKCEAGSPVVASPLVGPRAALVIGSAGKLTVASLASGEVLGTLDLAAIAGDAQFRSSPAAGGGRIVTGASNGSVIAVRGR